MPYMPFGERDGRGSRLGFGAELVSSQKELSLHVNEKSPRRTDTFSNFDCLASVHITHEIHLPDFIQLLDILERFSLKGRTFNANHDMCQPLQSGTDSSPK